MTLWSFSAPRLGNIFYFVMIVLKLWIDNRNDTYKISDQMFTLITKKSNTNYNQVKQGNILNKIIWHVWIREWVNGCFGVWGCEWMKNDNMDENIMSLTHWLVKLLYSYLYLFVCKEISKYMWEIKKIKNNQGQGHYITIIVLYSVPVSMNSLGS